MLYLFALTKFYFLQKLSVKRGYKKYIVNEWNPDCNYKSRKSELIMSYKCLHICISNHVLMFFRYTPLSAEKNENYCKVLIYYLNSEDKNIFCNAQIRWFSKQSVIYPFTKVNHRTDICHSAITERSRNVVKWQNYAIQLPSSWMPKFALWITKYYIRFISKLLYYASVRYAY